MVEDRGYLGPTLAAAALVVVTFLPAADAIDAPPAQAWQTALEEQPDGSALMWDQDGRSGMIVPIRVFQTATGTVCRDYESTISSAAGRPVTTRDVACRGDNGAWRPGGEVLQLAQGEE